ncbi:uracil-DNA glycosylase [Nocardia fluminea]|uniref:uracil-DNA glycosylase n=1 Tax=Nocardia fluminea TaxID=134984 RepID=UPI00364D773D
MGNDYQFGRAKLARLDTVHMAPLTKFVNGIAKAEGHNQLGAIPEVPYFDPDDGGTDARVLFLMHTCITKADAGVNGSGLISMENPDYTAQYIGRAHHLLRVDRKLCAYWNITPFPAEKKPASAVEQRRAAEYTREVLKLFPNLERIVLMGDSAKDGWKRQRVNHGIDPEHVFLPGKQSVGRGDLVTKYRELMSNVAGMCR